MKIAHLVVLLALFLTGPGYGQEMTFSKEAKSRTIRPGRGQVFTENFTRIGEFYFVQFGVYPSTMDLTKIKAPEGVGQVWLIEHKETTIKGVNTQGAYYNVKPYLSEEEAKAAVDRFKQLKINCWYNQALTGANFTLIGVAESATE